MANKIDYRAYGYDVSDIGLLNRTDQIKQYLEEQFSNITIDVDGQSIGETISSSLENVTESVSTTMNCISDKIDKTNVHMEKVKNEIIANVNSNNTCLCNLATKSDIQSAIETINANTDEKFEDLNEQVKGLIGNEDKSEGD